MTENNSSSTNSLSMETEEEIVHVAQQSVSQCRWVIGECAALWTQKYARGRTDADFAALIGLSGDQVFQRRRVFQTFSDVRSSYSTLKWSHFYAAVNWDDAADCFQWAEETSATVAEMKAWRRAIRGEDLTSEPEAEEETIAYVPTEPTAVQDPDSYGGAQGETARNRERADESSATQSAVARQKDGTDAEYSPFRQGAMTPPPKEQAGDTAVETREAPPVAQVVKRAAKTLQRIEAAITPEFAEVFRTLPEQEQNRFIKAVGDLSSKVAELL